MGTRKCNVLIKIMNVFLDSVINCVTYKRKLLRPSLSFCMSLYTLEYLDCGLVFLLLFLLLTLISETLLAVWTKYSNFFGYLYEYWCRWPTCRPTGPLVGLHTSYQRRLVYTRRTSLSACVFSLDILNVVLPLHPW